MDSLLSNRVGKSDTLRSHSRIALQVTYRRRPWVGVVRGWRAVLFGRGWSVGLLLITLTPVICKLHTGQMKNYKHILTLRLTFTKATGNSILSITES